MNIRDAHSQGDYTQVAGLMRAFNRRHYERYASDRQIIDSHFDPVVFEAELNSQPGAFEPPSGALLVAEEESRIPGCVALRDLAQGACVMKRMFVRPKYRGQGVVRRWRGRSSNGPSRSAIPG